MRKKFKRLRSNPAILGWFAIAVFIWKIIETADTLDAVVANMNAIWEFLSTPWGMIILLIIGLGLVLFAVLRPERANMASKESAVDSPLSDYDQRYADWMSAAIQGDVGNLSSCIMVREPHISWEHLEEREDAYIEFNFDIWSSSVLLLEISKQVEGHTRFQGGELERIPEITQRASQLSNLRRSKIAKLTIRQWLSFPVKGRMKIGYGREVEFDFSRVNILVVATLPDGSQGTTCRLPIPDIVRTQMPNHPNAPVLKSELEVTTPSIKIGEKISNDSFLFLVTVKFRPSAPIQLGKLDLMYDGKPYEPMKLPTKLVERTETYEVKYEVPGFIGDFRVKTGLHKVMNVPENERPQACLHVMAGGLDFYTDKVPIPTPNARLTPDKKGSQKK